VKARIDPITYPKTTINTEQPIEDCIKQALIALNASKIGNHEKQ
jgi:hypothetical protein